MGRAHLIALSLSTLLTVLFAPVLAGLLAALTVSISRPKYYKLLPIVLLLFFITLNLAREPSGDYIWYSKHYTWLVHGSLLDYFGVPLYGVSAKITEPIYHVYAKILSVLSSGDMIIYVIITTYIIYAIYSIAIKNLCTAFDLDKQSRTTLLVAGLTLCITFTLSNHLIRQYIASVAFILSITYAHHCDWRKSLLISLMAVLTHNTIIVPVTLMMISLIISRHPPKKTALLITLSLPASAFFGAWLVKTLSLEHDILSKSDGDISGITIFFDAVCFTGLLISYQKLCAFNAISTHQKTTLKAAILFYLLYAAFLIGISDSPLLWLRYYFYIEPVRALAFLAIIKLISCTTRHKGRSLALTAILVLGLIHTGMRMEKSPFDYGMQFHTYILEDMYDLVSRYEVRADNID